MGGAPKAPRPSPIFRAPGSGASATLGERAAIRLAGPLAIMNVLCRVGRAQAHKRAEEKRRADGDLGCRRQYTTWRRAAGGDLARHLDHRLPPHGAESGQCTPQPCGLVSGGASVPGAALQWAALVAELD